MKSKTTVLQKPLSEVITTEIDNNADGKIDFRSTKSNTYDKQENLIHSVEESDFAADGKIDFRSTKSNTYDKQGNLIHSVDERDDNADAKIDLEFINSNTYQYGSVKG